MNQLGDYFEPEVGEPVGSFFELPLQPAAPLRQPTGASPDGIGNVLSLSPLVRDWRRMRQRSTAGLGQSESTPPVPPLQEEPIINIASPGALVAWFILGAVARGAGGYFVGKAIAPSQQKELKYALWGIPVAILFGSLGLGVEAGIALSKR